MSKFGVENVHIRVADDPDNPLKAHSRVLELFSSVFTDLPVQLPDGMEELAEGRTDIDGTSRSVTAALTVTTWDLTRLINKGGAPVTRAVVQQWLDAVYAQVDSSRSLRLTSSGLNDAEPLLTFADAVGTDDVVMQSISRALVEDSDLHLMVPYGPPSAEGMSPAIRVYLHDAVYYAPTDANQAGTLWRCILNESHQQDLDAAGMAGAMAIDEGGFPALLAKELEAYLHLCGRLKLISLTRLLLDFLKLQCLPTTLSVLLPNMALVLSPRVLHFMPRELLLEGFVRDALEHRPAHVDMTAEKVDAVMSSPGAALWFTMKVNGSDTMSLEKAASGMNLLKRGPTALAIQAVIGGPTQDESKRLRTEIVTAALKS
ncbi:hypothetical protein HYH03_013605 [Edaphochlamys debaryana]|uniref:Uncharacterized protein n=1 Tax=Edaphochlamys debaryana TaxID=47281 RepID=A0A835XVU5_9CHLO|nr:hypothetical protein HYH03_013605 [Edaphochlamys debaryana]|eukprot:KAG2487760.1 hypothetical protein HYH03_013605 [Edaphochlamys debaryana]